MKIRSILCLFMMLFVTNSGFAALPPFAETTRELKAILEDEKLGASLGMSSPIESIQHISVETIEGVHSAYVIKTLTHQILVEIVPSEKQKVGPLAFKLRFNTPTPLELVK